MSGAPVTGGRAWTGTAVLVVAVVTGLATLRTLLAPGPWLPVTIAALVVVAVVTATVRSVGRSRFAPTGWGLLVSFGIVAALWSSPTGPRLPLPTLGTLRGLRRTAEAGIDAIQHSHIPMAPSVGVAMLVAGGALVVLLLADLLALGLRRPGAAGVALAALWSVVVVFERRIPLPLLVLGGTTFLLLLALVRPDRRPATRGTSRGGAAVVTAAALTLVAVLAAPLMTVLPGWDAVRLPTVWGSGAGSGPVRLSLDLDMRASLGSQSGRTLLTYTTDGPGGNGPLRLYTLTEFDGRQWQRGTEDPSETEQGVDGVLWPEAVPDPDASAVSTMRIRVGELDTDRLPVPLDPRSVTLPPGQDWGYDPGRDEVLSRTGTVRGLAYEVTVLDRDLSSESLQADSAMGADPGSPYLQVPQTPSVVDVRALAEEVTAEATTTHEQAVALQTWFRDATAFRYDTRVPAARSDDAVWDFLTDRRGYCVQYATAMTVMARSLGIPARLGVGFLPGRATAGGERAVTGRLAHTWPELWFEESGWVRFEPTPAVQTGVPPAYADPLAVEPVEPERDPSTPSAQPTTPPPPPREPGGGAGTGEVALAGARIPVGVVIAVAAALVLAVLAVRLRRRPRPPADAEAAWARLRRGLARDGITWSDARTPRSAAATLLERLPADAAAARTALERLVAAVEAERYAPAPAAETPEQLGAWVDEIQRAVVEHERRAARDETDRTPVGA